MGHQPSLERYSKTCYFSRQVSFVSKNPLHLGMGSMSKQGLQQGLYQQAIQTAKNMLKDKVDIKLISKYTSLSINEIEELKAKLDM